MSNLKLEEKINEALISVLSPEPDSPIIALISDISVEESKEVMEYFKNISIIIARDIGTPQKPLILLKIHGINSDDGYNYKTAKIATYERARELYAKGKYSAAIHVLTDSIINREYPGSYPFFLMGCCYLKLKNYKSAELYFTAALNLYDIREHQRGKSAININKIGRYRNYAKMNTQPEEPIDDSIIIQYRKQKLNGYKIDLELIYECATNEQTLRQYTKENIPKKVDIVFICRVLGYTMEETDIARLLLAIEYYAAGMEKKGGEFIRAVEKSKGKTAIVKDFLEKVRRDKKLHTERKLPNLPTTLTPGVRKSLGNYINDLISWRDISNLYNLVIQYMHINNVNLNKAIESIKTISLKDASYIRLYRAYEFYTQDGATNPTKAEEEEFKEEIYNHQKGKLDKSEGIIIADALCQYEIENSKDESVRELAQILKNNQDELLITKSAILIRDRKRKETIN